YSAVSATVTPWIAATESCINRAYINSSCSCAGHICACKCRVCVEG
ncbi:hypothetical protein TGAM01_v203762, partial [Trichoderma gamsii]